MATYNGQVIVLTGASQGIGKALALALAPQKAKLVLAARDEAALRAVESPVPGPRGPDPRGQGRMSRTRRIADA